MNNRIKRIVDVAMTVLLLCLMAYQVTGEMAHEWIGIGMTVLVIIHQILNRRWYGALFQGKYNPYRLATTILNILLLICFALTAFCGMSMSSYAVPFLYGMAPVFFVRRMHLSMSHWAFVLMGLHLGMHIPAMTAGLRQKERVRTVLGGIFTFVGGIGLWLFLRNGMPNYLFFRVPFAFLDYEKSGWLVFLENLLMLSFWAFIGTQAAHIFRNATQNPLIPVVAIMASVIIGIMLALMFPPAEEQMFFGDADWSFSQEGAMQGGDAAWGEAQPEAWNTMQPGGQGASQLGSQGVLQPGGQEASQPGGQGTSQPGGPEAAFADGGSEEPGNASLDDGFVLIQGGSFLMGSPESENWRIDDEAQHEVSVGSFYIDPHETTQDEYVRLVGSNPSTFSGEGLPVENISWLEAVRFANAKSQEAGILPAYNISGNGVSWDLSADGYRLPTEAEWEYACRAGTSTPFNTEKSLSAAEANFYGHYPYEIEENYFNNSVLEARPGEYRQTTITVGSFEPNAWGLYDMHGNVNEWCWDYYGAYDLNAVDNPTGPASGTRHVYRG